MCTCGVSLRGMVEVGFAEEVLGEVHVCVELDALIWRAGISALPCQVIR